MPDAFDAMFKSAALGSLVSAFRQDTPIVRNALGNKNVTTEVPDARFDEKPARKDDSAGKENVRGGLLYVPESLEVERRDSWTIAGELWITRAIGGVEGGERELELSRTEDILRQPKKPRSA